MAKKGGAVRRGASQRLRKEKAPPHLDAPQRVHVIRIRVLIGAFLVCFAVICCRLFVLQLQPDLKISLQDLGHVGETKILRERGSISDRNGRVLATNRDVPSLSADPSRVDDPYQLAVLLSQELGIEEDIILSRLTRRSRSGNRMRFVWIKRWLSDAEAARLGNFEHIPDGRALTMQYESVRYYPENEVAAHVLGFSNREGQGAEGLELTFDDYLRGRPGRRVSRVDNKRNFLGFLTLEFEAPTGGDDLELTLDSTLQFRLEQELDAAMEQHNAPRAMGVILDPDTGAILALATRPAFNPNHYWDYKPEERRNRAIIDVFEPGSSFKIVTASGALEHGLISASGLIDCEDGSFNPYGHRISDVHPLGVVTFAQCFSQSSNIGAIKVGALLGPERLESWIRRFGFGSRTGIELPGESPGLFRPRSRWSRLSMGSLPMGQEIAVTMLQMAQAFSTIANGGLRVEPYIVERAVSPEGIETYLHPREPAQRILSEETARTMRELCHQVVSEKNGTGWRAAISEYRVGGKTGTAQIARPDGRGYYKDRYTTVFAGFAPIADPKICAVIVVQEPMIRNHYGGYVCGPVFRTIVKEALVRLGTPEDPMDPEGGGIQRMKRTYPEFNDADTVVARFVLEALEPEEEALDKNLDGLELLPYHGDPTGEAAGLPDFYGMTKRQAKLKVVDLGLQWDPQGAGRVVAQDPPPGTRLQEITVCRLVFSDT